MSEQIWIEVACRIRLGVREALTADDCRSYRMRHIVHNPYILQVTEKATNDTSTMAIMTFYASPRRWLDVDDLTRVFQLAKCKDMRASNT